MREFVIIFRSGMDLEDDEDDSEEALQDMARGVMIDLLSQGPKFEVEIIEIEATQAVVFLRGADFKFTPEQLLARYDAGCRGIEDIDMRGILHEIIDDIRDSYRQAIAAMYRYEHRLDTSQDVSETEEEFVGRIETTIDDYIVNHYGDD